ncbi:5021_t:CDS:2 [Dentiscutata erythropus]|uniref:5021_t:CDS:1 n=1 Tax=Dentiscutata erythropus TaxID=1348616 RepID=A0A9N9IW25_9GLOM|nr:5021_t:CDS:2 [Dentiscutata erythropus]
MAVLNEDRFLARIGMSNQSETGFGGDGPSLKSNIINLISAVRTLMRSNSINSREHSGDNL